MGDFHLDWNVALILIVILVFSIYLTRETEEG